MTFPIKGIEWQITTNEDGTKRAIPTCPGHPTQEAMVEGVGPKGNGVLVSCPECESTLELCSKEEFEAEKKKILAIAQNHP